MHKNYLIFLLLILSCSEPVIQNNATLAFTQTEHDFGTLEIKQPAIYDFEFSNTGKTPLVIQNVETSCGCTVPEWTKEPVKPGKTGTITIKYDAEYPGVFSKSITVYYNGKNSPMHLKIKGSVNSPN